MSRAFSDIAFTPAVRAVQTRMGSRRNYASLDTTDDRRDRLGAMEAEFIGARDSFYQATVSETGWPYVQFRGGPAGFLKVLDEKTLGYADFRGNVQYISVGNLTGNDRVSIILMDYANRVRLKILGRARLVGIEDDPDLMAKLESPDYRARVERAVVITVEGFDWNCPQHITPRFTESEVAAATASLRTELAQLNARLASPNTSYSLDAPTELGNGPLALIVTGVRILTPRIRAYELRALDGGELPSVEPGAHIDVPVRVLKLAAETHSDATRRYSITASSSVHFEIAVQREPDGHGGSAGLHRDYQPGLTIHCGRPGNDFRLHTDSRPAILIAGGIGITPIRSMARAMAADGRSVSLHYAARSYRDAAYEGELRAALPGAFHLYLSDARERMDVDAIIRDGSIDSVFYVCGPARLIDRVRDAAHKAGIDPARVRYERFSAPPIIATDKPIRVTLRRSGKVIDVNMSETILDAVEAAGIDAPCACRAGNCGTCAVKVIEGVPDHRDAALSTTERDQAGMMCICVSRAKSTDLTLDL